MTAPIATIERTLEALAAAYHAERRFLEVARTGSSEDVLVARAQYQAACTAAGVADDQRAVDVVRRAVADGRRPAAAPETPRPSPSYSGARLLDNARTFVRITRDGAPLCNCEEHPVAIAGVLLRDALHDEAERFSAHAFARDHEAQLARTGFWLTADDVRAWAAGQGV